MKTSEEFKPEWSQMLADAVSKPGTVMQAYSNFHNYSMGNSLLAMFQCAARGISAGPMACFNRWKELGRFVKKGEKAITLCMPITIKSKQENEDGEESFKQIFVFKRNWFALSQTDGAEYVLDPLPTWNAELALSRLDIQRVPFEHMNGNVQGYAQDRKIAINPVAQVPHKTLFHELAHIVLGHTTESAFTDSETTPRNIREVEAESVSMICCESLRLDGAEFCRAYIQGWLASEKISDKSASRIFQAADKILKAGTTPENPIPTAV